MALYPVFLRLSKRMVDGGDLPKKGTSDIVHTIEGLLPVAIYDSCLVVRKIEVCNVYMLYYTVRVRHHKFDQDKGELTSLCGRSKPGCRRPLCSRYVPYDSVFLGRSEPVRARC